MWNDELFNKALFYALKSHGNQKLIQPSGVSYCAHVVGVLALAVNHNYNQNLDFNLIVPVALLHDTLEDTSVTYNDLVLEFGKAVADGVFALTKNNSLPSKEQMTDSLNKIVAQPKEIAIVKLADRCFNLRERVPVWTREKQEYYKLEAQTICDKLGFASCQLKQKLQHLINTY